VANDERLPWESYLVFSSTIQTKLFYSKFKFVISKLKVQQFALKLIIVSPASAIKFVMVREMPNEISLSCISKAFS